MNPIKNRGWTPEGKPFSCSTSGTHRVNLVASPVISHEWGKGPGSVSSYGIVIPSANSNAIHMISILITWTLNVWKDIMTIIMEIRMLLYPNYFMRSLIQRHDEGEYEVLSDDLLLSYNILSYWPRNF